MKNKLTGSCALMLVLVLAATLTPPGTGLGEAQTGRSQSLQAAIPAIGEGDWNLLGVSLVQRKCPVGEDTCAVFEDEGFRGSVRAELARNGGKKPVYVFTLLLARNLVDYGVRIPDVVFDTSDILGTPYCQFGSPGYPPGCVENFLNTHQFPNSNYSVALQVGTEDLLLGRLYLYLDAYDPQHTLHSLECQIPPKTVTITQTPDGATWTTAGSVSLTCREYYWAQGPGKKVPMQDVDVMTVGNTGSNFNFRIHWTK